MQKTKTKISTASCLGMHLFGGKFCIKTDGSNDACTCDEIGEQRKEEVTLQAAQELHQLSPLPTRQIRMDVRQFIRLNDDGNNVSLFEYAEPAGESVLMRQQQHPQEEPNGNRDRDEGDPLCLCDRKNFNNFLWATITVFQVRKGKKDNKE